MVVVFVVFAALSWLASRLMPHLASGLGIDMMLIYLLLAVIVALYGLFKRRAG